VRKYVKNEGGRGMPRAAETCHKVAKVGERRRVV
jgi:hypothetical protein